MASFLEALKAGAAGICNAVGNGLYAGPTHYLATGPLPLDQNTETVARQCLQNLNEHQKNQVYGKVWELAKMQDARIDGYEWGRHNALNDLERLAKALHRLGFLQQGLSVRHTVPCLSAAFGEGGIGSQYFSLVEKLGREPATGQLGLVNGMGVPTLEHAGRDANSLSESLLQGHNVHCVYHATHQNAPSGDLKGFARDVIRMKAVDGGSYTRTSYLIAQQWIDFLTTHPEAKYLQMSHSEGAAHVNAALRLTARSCPHLLSRIRVINFCPAHFINPNIYSSQLQVRNLVKREDAAINPWGTRADQIGACHPHIIVVPHTHDHPHNHCSEDYRNVARPFVQEFFRSGDLYPLIQPGSSTAATVQRTSTELLEDAMSALDRNDPDQASACVRQLPSNIAGDIFYQVWVAHGSPMDRGAHFGEDAFFGENQRSCDMQIKKTILQQVIVERRTH